MMNDHGQCSTSTSCSGSCSSCQIEENVCPVCGNVGFFVPFETVYNLANDFIKEQVADYQNDEFYICTHRACKIAYYTTTNARIFVNQINVPIWFKHDKTEYMVCYCRDITLEDVKLAVGELGEHTTKENIIKHLNKEDKKSDCLRQNPTGMCCDRLFNSAIQYSIKQMK